jgi:hypothetical protein
VGYGDAGLEAHTRDLAVSRTSVDRQIAIAEIPMRMRLRLEVN